MILQNLQKAIKTHGKISEYQSITTGAYDIATAKVEKQIVVKSTSMYMKNIKVSQFSFPNLIGKDVAMFYVIPSELGVEPKPNDKIVFNGKVYLVDSYQSFMLNGIFALYKIIGVK